MITLITPTADRPEGIRLCERWVAAQTMKPDQWIVADDGTEPAKLTMGQKHIRRPRKETGGASLARNILAAIPHVLGDVVLIFEDDDYYKSNHVEVCVERLKTVEATGCTWLNYYNIQMRAWCRIKNSCAALCNTAMRRDRLPSLERAARDAMAQGIYHIDRLFWLAAGSAGLHEQETVIGIKGLPGAAGIGIGHKAGPAWQRDAGGVKLRQWVGEDAEAYL